VAFAVLCAGLLVLVPSIDPAANEEAKFVVREVPVVDHNRIIVEPDRRFDFGTSLQLTSQETPEADEFFEKGIQVRVFRLPKTGFQPKHWAKFGHCLVYLAIVLPLQRNSNSTIKLTPLESESWLEPVGDQMERGRFLLVFEQVSDERPVVRLHEENIDQYFASGLYIEVTPIRQNYSRDEVNDLENDMKTARAELEAEININNRSRPCYRYKTVTAYRPGLADQVAMLTKCD